MKNPCKRILLFLVSSYWSIVFIILGFMVFSGYLLVQGYTQPAMRTITPDLNQSCKDGNLPFCKIENDYQFEKFMMFALDGVSWHFAQPVVTLFGEHAHVYTTYTDLCRFTCAVFRSWCSGRDNNNMQWGAVKEDTVFHSFYRTYGRKMQIAFGGSWYLRMFTEPPEPYFRKITLWYDQPPLDNYHAFSRWIHPKNISAFYEYAADMANANASVVTHFGSTDIVQHGESDLYLVLFQFFFSCSSVCNCCVTPR